MIFINFRVGRDFGQLEDVRNRFLFPSLALKTLFWSLFDPGHPGVVGCTEGMSRYSTDRTRCQDIFNNRARLAVDDSSDSVICWATNAHAQVTFLFLMQPYYMSST